MPVEEGKEKDGEEEQEEGLDEGVGKSRGRGKAFCSLSLFKNGPTLLTQRE